MKTKKRAVAIVKSAPVAVKKTVAVKAGNVPRAKIVAALKRLHPMD
jgi:hypothetical protein